MFLDVGMCPEGFNRERKMGDKSALCSEPRPEGRLTLELYGKLAPRLGRKMGHLTITAATPALARERALENDLALLLTTHQWHDHTSAGEIAQQIAP